MSNSTSTQFRKRNVSITTLGLKVTNKKSIFQLKYYNNIQFNNIQFRCVEQEYI